MFFGCYRSYKGLKGLSITELIYRYLEQIGRRILPNKLLKVPKETVKEKRADIYLLCILMPAYSSFSLPKGWRDKPVGLEKSTRGWCDLKPF